MNSLQNERQTGVHFVTSPAISKLPVRIQYNWMERSPSTIHNTFDGIPLFAAPSAAGISTKHAIIAFSGASQKSIASRELLRREAPQIFII
jgi:hypothetical protein